MVTLSVPFFLPDEISWTRLDAWPDTPDLATTTQVYAHVTKSTTFFSEIITNPGLSDLALASQSLLVGSLRPSELSACVENAARSFSYKLNLDYLIGSGVN
jgi:hypothetical protein